MLELLRLRKVMNKRLLKKVVDVVLCYCCHYRWLGEPTSFPILFTRCSCCCNAGEIFLSFPPFSPPLHCSGNREKQIWGGGGGGRNSITFRSFSRRISPLSGGPTKLLRKKSVKSAAAEGRIAIREFPEKGEGSKVCNLFPPPFFDRIIEGGVFSANVT